MATEASWRLYIPYNDYNAVSMIHNVGINLFPQFFATSSVWGPRLVRLFHSEYLAQFSQLCAERRLFPDHRDMDCRRAIDIVQVSESIF